MSNMPKTDSEALALFLEMAMSVESATERERIALALIVGVYYGQAKHIASKSGIINDQATLVYAAFSRALDKAADALAKVDARGAA